MRKERLSVEILTLLAVIMILLAFLPAYFIGYLYFGLVVVYLALLYVVERRGRMRLSMIISYLFGLLVVYLVMKKAGKWDVRLFALVVVLGALSLIRGVKNESGPNPDAG
jgi:peptidoglycan/LPS O-acetylase OafA/YrhL